jgi:hypothetical protein
VVPQAKALGHNFIVVVQQKAIQVDEIVRHPGLRCAGLYNEEGLIMGADLVDEECIMVPADWADGVCTSARTKCLVVAVVGLAGREHALWVASEVEEVPYFRAVVPSY